MASLISSLHLPTLEFFFEANPRDLYVSVKDKDTFLLVLKT